MLPMHEKAEKYRDMTERRLASIFSGIKEPARLSLLYDSMRYSVDAGGKRIRPLLSAAACEILEVSFDCLLGYVCAIELIHTYSLIHDDLPALDNDDFRRGKPSNHMVYGEGTAILAGDALLNMAAEMLVAEIRNSPDMKAAAEASGYILKSAGPEGMLAGQAVDTFTEKQHITYDGLLTMHSLKTGRIIKAALCFPAIICGQNELFRELEIIAELIGLAFQIKDDILDVEGDFEKLGKTIGKDQRSDKMTFVSAVGIEKSKKMLAETAGSAYAAAEKMKGDPGFLKYLIMLVADRDN